MFLLLRAAVGWKKAESSESSVLPMAARLLQFVANWPNKAVKVIQAPQPTCLIMAHRSTACRPWVKTALTFAPQRPAVSFFRLN